MKRMFGLLHIFRQIDDDRARTAAAGDIKRFLDDARNILDVLDQEIVLGARTRDADEVRFLESVVADHRGRNLAREHDHRRRVHVSVGDAGDGVGRAGARGDQHDAGASTHARIAFGHVGRALFVADEDVLDLRVEQRVVSGQDGAAGIAEDYIDAFGDQALDNDLCSREFFHFSDFSLVLP